MKLGREYRCSGEKDTTVHVFTGCLRRLHGKKRGEKWIADVTIKLLKNMSGMFQMYILQWRKANITAGVAELAFFFCMIYIEACQILFFDNKIVKSSPS